MFDIKEEMEVASQVITTLMEQLDVFLSIKPKPKQPSKVPSFPMHTLKLSTSECVMSFSVSLSLL